MKRTAHGWFHCEGIRPPSETIKHHILKKLPDLKHAYSTISFHEYKSCRYLKMEPLYPSVYNALDYGDVALNIVQLLYRKTAKNLKFVCYRCIVFRILPECAVKESSIMCKNRDLVYREMIASKNNSSTKKQFSFKILNIYFYHEINMGNPIAGSMIAMIIWFFM